MQSSPENEDEIESETEDELDVITKFENMVNNQTEQSFGHQVKDKEDKGKLPETASPYKRSLRDRKTRTMEAMEESILSITHKPPKKKHKTKRLKQEKSFHARKDDLYVCTYGSCGKTCTSSSNLKVHMRTHTNERPYTCDYCQRSFASSGNLKVHIRTHTKEKPFQCTFCEKSYATSANLKVHIRTHTKERPFVCPFENCSKTCSTSANMNSHMRVHSETKDSFVCPYEECKKLLSTSGNLKKHLLTHTKERSFSCTVANCGKVFATSSNLTVHMRTHNSSRSFVCPHCDKTFRKPGSLKTHSRVHVLDYKPPVLLKPKFYLCDECGKAFFSAGALKIHKNSHLEEKNLPFACSFPNCTKRCTTGQNLSLHMKQHGKNMTCLAMDCEEKFKEYFQLCQHMLLHPEIQDRFCCPIIGCPERFAEPSFLKIHLRTCDFLGNDNHIGEEDFCREHENNKDIPVNINGNNNFIADKIADVDADANVDVNVHVNAKSIGNVNENYDTKIKDQDMDENSQNKNKNDDNDNRVQSSFTCLAENCGDMFTSHMELNRHTEHHASDTHFCCVFGCEEKFKDRFSLRLHSCNCEYLASRIASLSAPSSKSKSEANASNSEKRTKPKSKRQSKKMKEKVAVKDKSTGAGTTSKGVMKKGKTAKSQRRKSPGNPDQNHLSHKTEMDVYSAEPCKEKKRKQGEENFEPKEARNKSPSSKSQNPIVTQNKSQNQIQASSPRLNAGSSQNRNQSPTTNHEKAKTDTIIGHQSEHQNNQGFTDCEIQNQNTSLGHNPNATETPSNGKCNEENQHSIKIAKTQNPNHFSSGSMEKDENSGTGDIIVDHSRSDRITINSDHEGALNQNPSCLKLPMKRLSSGQNNLNSQIENENGFFYGNSGSLNQYQDQIQQPYRPHQQDNKFEVDLSIRKSSDQFPTEDVDTVQNQAGDKESEPGNTGYSNKSDNGNSNNYCLDDNDNYSYSGPFQCSRCPMSFFSMHALNEHQYGSHGIMNDYNTNLPFQCVFCPLTFHTMNLLARHEYMDHGVLRKAITLSMESTASSTLQVNISCEEMDGVDDDYNKVTSW